MTHNELCTLRLLLRHLLRLNSGSVLSAKSQLRSRGVDVSAGAQAQQTLQLLPE